MSLQTECCVAADCEINLISNVAPVPAWVGSIFAAAVAVSLAEYFSFLGRMNGYG